MKYFGAFLICIVILVSTSVFAQDKPAKISGYMFGDIYWVAANHNAMAEHQTGLWFRRIYLTYDKTLSNEFSARLRFEANSPDYDDASAKLTPYLKDAYLKRTLGQHNIIFGLSPSPTWERVEAIWGYRSGEKTPLDLQKWGGSRDLGLAFQGALDPDKKLLYHLLIGNGSDTSSETNKGKKIYLSLAGKPMPGVTVEVYGDWEDKPFGKDYMTLQGFASYEQKMYRAGVHFAQQTRKDPAGDTKLELFSVFGAGQIKEKMWAYGRVDKMFDPNSSGSSISYIPFDNNAKSMLIIAGIDCKPIPDVHIMPNFEVVLYEKPDLGTKPRTDFIPRLTAYFTF